MAALFITGSVLLLAAGSIVVCLLVQRDEPAGMPHAVREAARWAGRRTHTRARHRVGGGRRG